MKNILLLFLSDVKINKSTDSISEARYENVEGENTQTTNESAVRYLLKDFPIDKIFIFASKKVRGKIVGYLDKDGTTRNHLQFSLDRFRKFLPEMDYFAFDYDEDGSDDDNLKSIAEMAQHIQEFAVGEEVTLHIDLTGGMRHVNMIMLELTRLLEYSGIKVGKVLYSNYRGSTTPGTVEEIQNVYDLFQLIAGVEEFVNFGSVKALKIYYKDKKISEPLKKLCEAMENFAEAIKLCHYGQFRKAIENLHDAIHDFNTYESADVEDILMARLIGRINENYRDLIAIREKDDLQVIRWCLDNDYLQQALTLYTERIPEYLGEKKIIIQTETESKKLAELTCKDVMKRNQWFYLFSDVSPKGDVLNEGKKNCCKAIKDAIKLIIKNKPLYFEEWLADLNEKIVAPLRLTRTDTQELYSQLETIIEVLQDPKLLLDLSAPKLNPIREIVVELSEKFETEVKGFKRKKILEYFLNNISDTNVLKYFSVGGFIKLMSDYPKAIKIYELLVEKVFSLSNSMPIETFLNIVDKYYRIKDERNHSAHAREDHGEFKTTKKLREVMSKGIKEIQANLPPQ